MRLSDKEIKEALQQEKIAVDPFAESSLQPSSYDLRISQIVHVSGRDIPIDLSKEGQLTLGPGHFALVTTLERIKMPLDMTGVVGPRGTWNRKGLLLLYGEHVDPGWEGPLILGIYNISSRPLRIPFEVRICSLSFYRMGSPADKPYVPTQDQREGKIPASDIQYIQTQTVRTLGDLDQAVRFVEQTARELNASVIALRQDIAQLVRSELREELQTRIGPFQGWMQVALGVIFTALVGLAGALVWLAFEVGKLAP